MRTSEAIDQIGDACAKAQRELKPAVKNATNPHFKSSYADLASVLEASRVYAVHNVAIFQDVLLNAEGAEVTTRLVHNSGQWIEFGPLTIPLSKRDGQGVGSATSYAKRYALSAAGSISADVDDDGNAAVQSVQQTRVEKPPDFDEWLGDLEQAALRGTAMLRTTWRDSKPELRDYLTLTDPARWKKIKDTADLQQKEPAHA